MKFKDVVTGNTLRVTNAFVAGQYQKRPERYTVIPEKEAAVKQPGKPAGGGK